MLGGNILGCTPIEASASAQSFVANYLDAYHQDASLLFEKYTTLSPNKKDDIVCAAKNQDHSEPVQATLFQPLQDDLESATDILEKLINRTSANEDIANKLGADRTPAENTITSTNVSEPHSKADNNSPMTVTQDNPHISDISFAERPMDDTVGNLTRKRSMAPLTSATDEAADLQKSAAIKKRRKRAIEKTMCAKCNVLIYGRLRKKGDMCENCSSQTVPPKLDNKKDESRQPNSPPYSYENHNQSTNIQSKHFPAPPPPRNIAFEWQHSLPRQTSVNAHPPRDPSSIPVPTYAYLSHNPGYYNFGNRESQINPPQYAYSTCRRISMDAGLYHRPTPPTDNYLLHYSRRNTIAAHPIIDRMPGNNKPWLPLNAENSLDSVYPPRHENGPTYHDTTRIPTHDLKVTRGTIGSYKEFVDEVRYMGNEQLESILEDLNRRVAVIRGLLGK